MEKRKPKQSELAALEDLRRQIKNARAKGHMKEVAELYNQLGNQYRLLGNYEYALDAHQEEINISTAHNKHDKMALGIAYRNMGEVLMEMKNDTGALRYIHMYLKVAKAEGNLVEQQRALITLGRAYLSMVEEKESSEENGNSENKLSPDTAMEKAFSYFRQAYLLLNEDELKDQVNNEKELMLMKCSNCQNIGVTLELQGKFSEATTWLTKAVDIGSKYQFHENLAPCYTMLCSLLLKDGKRKEALAAAKNATKTARSLGNQQLEVESLIWEAKALFMNDEVDAGKKILKKLRQRIKKHKDLHDYLNELEPLLTAAVCISRTLDILFITSQDDAAAKLKLHEKLGDNFTVLTNYEAAIKHYKKACEFAVTLCIGGKKLSRLYYSIAETYRDLENYDKAFKYYMEEMRLHSGNLVEEFKTQTNITVALEKLKKPPEEIIKAHELAVSLARRTKSLVKEVTALNNFSLYLKSIGRGTEAEKMRKEANDIKTKHNITDTEETDTDSQDLLEEDDCIDLDDLSEEDDSDDEAEDGRKNVTKRLNVKRNEVGETQLHIAAKKGDLKAVRRLIRQGHPLKIRDNAGWTPLHEACNFGHVAVVEELLKSGSDVNDAGGALSERITPLHDAAGNCNCDTIKILIKYGANVLARDSKGRYPIDSLLCWRETDGKGCSEDELVGYREVKELLIGRMAKAGKIYREEDEKKARKRAKAQRSPSPEKSILLVTKSYDQDCPILAKTIVDDYDPDQEGNGKELYKSAMKQLGRKPLEERTTRKERPRPISPGPRGALVPSDKDFHQKHDDWLLPDDAVIPSISKKHQSVKPKRKRDPEEDAVLDKRNTKRKTKRGTSGPWNNGDSEELPVMGREDDSDNEDELMDIESPPPVHFNRGGTPTPSPIGVSSSSNSGTGAMEDVPICNFEDEDFSEILNDGLDDFPISGGNEEFLPSQRPSFSRVEFGKTVDVPEVSDDESKVKPTDRARLGNKSNSTKRHRTGVINISSDEDNDDATKLTDLSRVLRQTNNNRRGDKSRFKEKSFVQTRLPVKILPRTTHSFDSDGETISPPPAISTGNGRRRTTSSSAATIIPNANQTSVNDKQKKEVLRLKIRILEKVLLVPVDDAHINESIDWLAKESAERYLRSYGVKPILSLQTKDGASLSGADPISLVLEANERELDGIVTSFDLPPLVERYSTACTENTIETNSEIKACLNDCQSSNILILRDISLRGKSSSVLMTALLRQNSLRVLCLAGCSLFDTGVSELCKAIPTLTGLTELDLSSNGITKAGFVTFSDVFLRESQSNESVLSFCTVPLGLSSLVLSHNPLGNQIGTALAALVNKLSALKRLELSDCDLSDKLFLWNKNELTKALNNSRLEEFDISYNAFKDAGLEKCLQSLPARRIRTLNCSSCVPCGNNSTLDVAAKAVETFLSGNEDCCNLTTLRLNDCGLTDKSMELILNNFDRLVRLERLELACNDTLTSLSLVNVLERSVEQEIPLTNLDIGSIPSLWNSRTSKEQILNALQKKLSSQIKLSSLRVPISDVECENTVEDGTQINLPHLEQKMVDLMSDFAGNANFHYEKQGACITYHFDD